MYHPPLPETCRRLWYDLVTINPTGQLGLVRSFQFDTAVALNQDPPEARVEYWEVTWRKIESRAS